jgi:hypothetical protein
MECTLQNLLVLLWPFDINVEPNDVSILPTVVDHTANRVESKAYTLGFEVQVPQSLIFFQNVVFSLALHPSLHVTSVDDSTTIFLALDDFFLEDATFFARSHSEHHPVLWEEANIPISEYLVSLPENQLELTHYLHVGVSINFEEFDEFQICVDFGLLAHFVAINLQFFLSFIQIFSFDYFFGLFLR